MSYDNTNTAVIFKNDNATGNQPAYKGTINVDGRELEISLWIKDGKAGKFFSGKISEPYKKMENTSDKIARESSGLPF